MVGGNEYGENIHFPWFFTCLRIFPFIPKMNIFQFLDGNECFVRLVGGSKYRENIHFSMAFHWFVYVPIDPFSNFWMEYLCFARISIITKHRDGALVVVVGGKYGESIHFSKFFRGLAMPPLIPKRIFFKYDMKKWLVCS